jgi:hypothetical protein
LTGIRRAAVYPKASMNDQLLHPHMCRAVHHIRLCYETVSHACCHLTRFGVAIECELVMSNTNDMYKPCAVYNRVR